VTSNELGFDFRSELETAARSIGLTRVGVAPAQPSEHAEAYRVWLGRGLHGTMAYLAREDAVARRGDPARSLPGAESVLVAMDAYGDTDRPERIADPSRGIVARYARGRDYHQVLERKLRALLGWLDGRVPGGARGRVYVDTGPVLERELARRAGLGWFGRNTMLIDPTRGSYFFLGVILVDVELPADEPFAPDRCGTCRACLDACPTGALLGRNAEGAPIMDATRCISYLTIELRGPIPRELRPAIGNRVYGCDICQEVCPFNQRFAGESEESGYAARGPGERPMGVQAEPRIAPAPHAGTEAPSLIELLETALDTDRWEAFSRGSAIRRAGRSGFARNVCVAMGNWGSPEAVAPLGAALADPEPLVREHAAWALGRVGGIDAEAVLREQQESEGDPAVRAELADALRRVRSVAPLEDPGGASRPPAFPDHPNRDSV
jgi:epoxyqueuosine reductase